MHKTKSQKDRKHIRLSHQTLWTAVLVPWEIQPCYQECQGQDGVSEQTHGENTV